MNSNQDIIRNSCAISTNTLECIELLNDEQKAFLESKTVNVFYQKGEVLTKQGAFASHVMILREGLVKTYIEGVSDNLILQIFSPINIIGLSTLFEGNAVFHHSTQAYIDTQVSLIDISAFKQLINQNSGFASKIVSLLAEQSIITNGRFYCLTKKQTYGRLADVILCLANRIYKKNKFPLQLSRKEFAELSGMSIESIARILTKFKNDGLLEINSEYVEILDLDKLSRVSMHG